MQKLARSCNAIFLGEHYLTATEGGKEGREEKDQVLAARIVEELQKYKPKVSMKEREGGREGRRAGGLEEGVAFVQKSA